jgi:hypothetical protein
MPVTQTTKSRTMSSNIAFIDSRVTDYQTLIDSLDQI